MNTEHRTEIPKIEIIPLDLTITGKATGNMVVYKESVLNYLEAIEKIELVTDEDFGDAENFIKILAEQEALILEAENKAKSGSQSLADAFEVLASSKKVMAKTRCSLAGKVKDRKAQIKDDLIEKSVGEIREFEDTLISKLLLNVDLQRKTEYLSFLEGAAKNKRNIDSIKTSLASVVEQVNEATEARLNQFAANKEIIEGHEHQHLFSDKSTLLQLPTVELLAVIKERNQKEEDRLEKIKIDEQLKAEAKAQKELEEKQEAKRIEQERLDREEADKHMEKVKEAIFAVTDGDVNYNMMLAWAKINLSEDERTQVMISFGMHPEMAALSVEKVYKKYLESLEAEKPAIGEVVDASFEIIEDDPVIRENRTTENQFRDPKEMAENPTDKQNLTVETMDQIETYQITLQGSWEFQASKEQAQGEARELREYLESRFGKAVSLDRVNTLANQQG